MPDGEWEEVGLKEAQFVHSRKAKQTAHNRNQTARLHWGGGRPSAPTHAITGNNVEFGYRNAVTPLAHEDKGHGLSS